MLCVEAPRSVSQVSGPPATDSVVLAPLAAALGRARTVAPRQVDRASRELRATLAWRDRTALGELALSTSALTPAGSPVELAVTSAADEVRTVVEVVAPEDDRRTALDAAHVQAAAFGATALDRATLDLLVAHQRGFTNRFGAWLGSRHGRDSSRHKIYVELNPDPASAWQLLDTLNPSMRRAIGGMGRMPFVGIHLDGSGTVEVYVRPPNFEVDQLAVVAHRMGIAASTTNRLIDAMIGDGPRPSGRNHGISVAFRSDTPCALATFGFARRRYGRDHKTRHHLIEQAKAEHWPSLDLYAHLTEPLATPRPMVRPVHSAIAHIASPATEVIEHHITFAPPTAKSKEPIPIHTGESK